MSRVPGKTSKRWFVRNDDAARHLLTAASLYATSRLSEVESRLHYLRSLRGEI
jgi:hypothetical protein